MNKKTIEVSDEEIRMIEEYRANKLKQQAESKKQKEKEKQYNKLKKTEKYKILLELLNKILSNCGKNEIKDVLEFKRIDRKDVIKYDVLNDDEMIGRVFGPFDKRKCGWYRRKSVEYYVMTLLKCMCEFINHKLESNEKKIQRSNKKKITINYVCDYSIKYID